TPPKHKRHKENNPAFFVPDARECGRHQHRLFHRTTHCRNAANFVHRRPDHREIEPFRASDVAVKNLADMKTKIHFGNRRPSATRRLFSLMTPCRAATAAASAALQAISLKTPPLTLLGEAQVHRLVWQRLN